MGVGNAVRKAVRNAVRNPSVKEAEGIEAAETLKLLSL